MLKLVEMSCLPVSREEQPLSDTEIQTLQAQVSGWKVLVQDTIQRLERSFKFRNFVEALVFTNLVGELAEVEDHHPAILTEWGKVTVTLWTHAIKGLHRNDFIMAAKTDRLYKI